DARLGSAAALKERTNTSDLLEPDLYSKKCPPGTYVSNTSSKCSPCKRGEYTEYPNDLPNCLPCHTCREDQVELSPCIATRNTQCACRNGTFCSPDHPCEMCQKCRARCPKDQVEIAPCTPHSDLRCGPPTDTSSSSGVSTVAVVVSILVVVVVIVLGVCLWKQCFSHRAAGEGGERSSKPGSVVNRLVLRLTRCCWGGMGMRDNDRNKQIEQEQGLLPAARGSGLEVGHSLGGCCWTFSFQQTSPVSSNPTAEARKKLVPVPGEDPVVLLRRSFDIFARSVPLKDWKRFGRALDLLENDIDQAELYNKLLGEPIFQVLNVWLNRQGTNASINTLLGTLSRIELSGVAGDIASKLVQEGYFQYEVS
ncbi:TR10B factor, partial [Penelope pileata]|nr:TR10B factor [Penelope pileata]